MGELIRREAASAPLPFIGERLTSAVSGQQVEIEHYHRYLLARDYCRDRDVLDVASGEGYGTALLAQVARSAVGVEIDPAVVAAARTEFARPNLRYEQGDARNLPLPDASVDVVVSFETLEHILEQGVFIGEVRRVLRPGGLLVISTPDRDVYSAAGTPPNPYHALELTRAEFETLLRRHFAHASFAVQRAMIGSLTMGATANVSPRVFERRGDTHIEASDHMPRAPYVVAVASDGPLPPLPDSIYVHRADLDTDLDLRMRAEGRLRAAEEETAQARTERDQAEAARAQADAEKNQAQAATGEAEATKARAEVERDQAQAAAARAEVESRQVEDDRAAAARSVAALERQLAEEARGRAELADAHHAALVEKDEEIGNLRARADKAEEDLRAVLYSTSWHLTAPLRRVGSISPTFARYGRRTLKFMWWTATLQIHQRYRQRRQMRTALAEAVAQPMPVARQTGDSQADGNLFSGRYAHLAIRTSTDPVVSVVIPTYGKVDFTWRCLASIAAHPPRSSIEVIVVDDAYAGPEDVGALDRVEGIKLIRNEANQGFLRSCNLAARAAGGRFLYFLNNDTELTPGAIDNLADALESRPDVGMVGSKLLFPDGRLQEAGGIIWNDASGWNYGRGDDPNRPEYNYVREVDYCSGASIMVRRALFDTLKGFEENFVPAYYEDVDLAFRTRAQGLKVLFEPRSVVVHHEGISHGTGTGTGVKAHQAANRTRFLERWGGTLLRENFSSGEHVLRARDRARDRRVILVVDHYVPEPDRDAGSRSAMGIIASLVDAGWVVKFWPHNRSYSPTYTPALEALGVEVLDDRWPGDLSTWMGTNGGELDHVMLIRPQIAEDVVRDVTRGTAAVLSYYGVDLHFARVRRQAKVAGDPALLQEAAALERMERRVWRHFDVLIYPSEEEADAVRALSPHAVVRGIVPFFFDQRPPRTVAPTGRAVLFVAGFAHPPNVDAATFLVREVLPLLQSDLPDVRVVLAGSKPADAVRALADVSVRVTGYVTDDELDGLYDECRAAVVPLRFGAGVKGKVVEALSYGLPLVTTSVGAQGIEGLEAIVSIRDSASEIAAALKLLLTDDVAWTGQSRAQMNFARRRFSRAAMGASVLAALEAGEAARTPAVESAVSDVAREPPGRASDDRSPRPGSSDGDLSAAGAPPPPSPPALASSS